ncbi:MAG: hypothetical protein J6U54_04095 [Clostridiales bacterium]|nr:hypothetical protein [Clostridiales bacterium]
MKQYDDLDKKLESVMKKNLSGTKASDELIRQTLNRINMEKLNNGNGSKGNSGKGPKKPHVPVALISGIAAAVIAVVGVGLIITAVNNGKANKSSDTISSAINSISPADSGEKVLSTSANVAEDIEEIDSVDSVYAGSKSDSIALEDSSNHYMSNGDVAAGELRNDLNRTSNSWDSVFNLGGSPFNSLNNYYSSIENKVWSAFEKQGDNIGNSSDYGKKPNSESGS